MIIQTNKQKQILTNKHKFLVILLMLGFEQVRNTALNINKPQRKQLVSEISFQIIQAPSP